MSPPSLFSSNNSYPSQPRNRFCQKYVYSTSVIHILSPLVFAREYLQRYILPLVVGCVPEIYSPIFTETSIQNFFLLISPFCIPLYTLHNNNTGFNSVEYRPSEVVAGNYIFLQDNSKLGLSWAKLTLAFFG